MEYIVQAYSPSQNTLQRELNLMSSPPKTESEALQHATSFAQRLNAQALLGARDWQARIELVNSQYHARTL